MAKTVTVDIRGGLGNQMFQYAAGRALSLRLGARLVLDTNWFTKVPPKSTPRDFGLGAFPAIAAARAAGTIGVAGGRVRGSASERLWRAFQGSRVVEPWFGYWPGLSAVDRSAYLVGDWQSPCYFAEWQQVIRSDFAFPPPHEAEVTALATAIRGARNPVAVHVRRGDYAHSPRVVAVHAGCATQRYYHQALMALRERRGALDIFVFSDEGDVAGALIAEVLQPLDRVTVASAGGMPWRDLYLMSLARDHIIANSSFSWWGAWLSPENGIVAAPNRWFAADPASGRPNRDHLPDHWIAVGG
ncbi:MAG: alpha-1,2-fucosyltransferase [Bauldia sp.]